MTNKKIPVNPNNYYSSHGTWKGWGDLLGANLPETPTQLKPQLLALAKENHPRPPKQSRLGRVLQYLLYKERDKEFSLEIKKLRPDWFKSPDGFLWSVIKKKELLKTMALSDEELPRIGTKLRGNFCSYTNKSHTSFDAIFTNELKNLRPDWFESQKHLVKEKKKKLLAMAKDKTCKKPRQSEELGGEFVRYTSLKGGRKSYDLTFTRKLMKIRPEWFRLLKYETKKKNILTLAKKGAPKPAWSSSLGKAIRAFIYKHTSTFDSKFANALKKIRPEWFGAGSYKRFKVRCIETKKIYNSVTEVSQKTGVSAARISYVIKNPQYTCRGLHWERI